MIEAVRYARRVAPELRSTSQRFVLLALASGEDTRTCENTCDVCNAMMVSLAVEVLERRQERCDRCRHWVPEEGEPDGVCKELSEWTDPDFYCGYWEA